MCKQPLLLHPDHQYIEALRNHHAALIEVIYQQHARPIQQTLAQMGADAATSGDIFQEALIDLYKLAYDGKFVLTCPLQAFLLLLCKRKWINQMKKNQRSRVTNTDVAAYSTITDTDEAAAHMLQLEKESLVMAMLDKISARCKEIILASYTNHSQQALAKELGVSYAYLRKKKSLCMNELIEKVQNHPLQ